MIYVCLFLAHDSMICLLDVLLVKACGVGRVALSCILWDVIHADVFDVLLVWGTEFTDAWSFVIICVVNILAWCWKIRNRRNSNCTFGMILQHKWTSFANNMNFRMFDSRIASKGLRLLIRIGVVLHIATFTLVPIYCWRGYIHIKLGRHFSYICKLLNRCKYFGLN